MDFMGGAGVFRAGKYNNRREKCHNSYIFSCRSCTKEYYAGYNQPDGVKG